MANENYEVNFASGEGKDSPVPDIVKKRFNWGVFFLPFFWSFGNKTYIPLIVIGITIVINLVPIIGAIISLILDIATSIWMGIKGNEWAWQNKHWASVEHFHKIQKLWAIWGIVVACVIGPILIILIILLYCIAFGAFMGPLASSKNLNLNPTTGIVSPCGIEKSELALILSGANIDSDAKFTEIMSSHYTNSTNTKNSITTPEKKYVYFAKGNCDIKLKNCGIAIEKNNTRICRFFIGQNEIVEVK